MTTTQETKTFVGVLLSKSEKQGPKQMYWPVELGDKTRPTKFNVMKAADAEALRVGKTYEIKYVEAPNPKGNYPFKNLTGIQEVDASKQASTPVPLTGQSSQQNGYDARDASIQRQVALKAAVEFGIATGFTADEVIYTAQQFADWLANTPTVQHQALMDGSRKVIHVAAESDSPPAETTTNAPTPVTHTEREDKATSVKFWTDAYKWIDEHQPKGEKPLNIPAKQALIYERLGGLSPDAWVKAQSGRTFEDALAAVKVG